MAYYVYTAAWDGRSGIPVAVLEVDLYRSLILDEHVTTGCLPDIRDYLGLNGSLSLAEEDYKINVAAGWGSIDSRQGNEQPSMCSSV